MFSWTPGGYRFPLVVAHRGSSALAPENTLAAFRRAIEDGADAIELDVRLTRDEEVIVFHDSTLRRTTDGRGRVEEQTLSKLRELTAGRWYGRQFAVEQIPTLAEVFQLVRESVGINIELKSDVRSRRRSLLVERCCDVIRTHRGESVTLLTSFHHQSVLEAREHLPHLTCGFLFHPLQHLTATRLKNVRNAGIEYIVLGGPSMRKNAVERAHGLGLHVGEFTINTPGRLRRAVRYRADAIFTDSPARMLQLLSAETKKIP